MIKVFTKIEDVNKEWGELKNSNFLDLDFLQIYYLNHPQLKHLFVTDTNMRLYAHIVKLAFNKTNNYLQNNSVGNVLLSFISFEVLYLTNSFITNLPSFKSDEKINLDQLLSAIRENYSIIVIPDFLFKNITVENDNYTKIEVEEEMVLEIRSEWNELKDYISDLRKKYRYKMNSIIKKTNDIEIRNLTENDLEYYALDIQKLFVEVVVSSQFRGPDFNTASFVSFVNLGYMRVTGYFLNEKLIGFSSDMPREKMLYSYFVGFDKNLNKSIPIYGRILLENIHTAIKLRKERLILGRTANEYKSNFGALPIKSFVYLKIKNKFLRTFLRPIYSKLKINNWKQRSPLK